MKAQRNILTLLIASTIALPLSAIAQAPDPFKCLNSDEIKNVPLIDYPPETTAPTPSIHLKRLSTCRAGYFNSKGSEIVAHDPNTQRLFVVNMAAGVSDRSPTLDVLDIHDPLAPVRLFSIQLCDDLFGGKPIPTSVAVHASLPESLVALAVQPPENLNPMPPSKVLFYNAAIASPSVQCPEPLRTLEVGHGADMVTFTPDGTRVLVANGGSANLVGSANLPGSVSIIDIATWTVTDVTFSGVQIPPGVRIPPAPTPAPPDWKAQNYLKPEYIAVSPDSQTAWVTLEVNNAMAVVDIVNTTISSIHALGYKNYNNSPNKLDPSDATSSGINITNWPVFGMYQPDAIAAYRPGDQTYPTYLVTANEGIQFKYPGEPPDERKRVRDLDLADSLLPYKDNDKLGRLRVTNLQGDTNGDGKFEELYTFGARSFSIWSGNGQLVFDSAADFEEITAKALVVGNKQYFNADDNDNVLDSKSDDQGPEPDGVNVGKVYDRYYAFTVLVRPGGIMVYDITDPEHEPPLFQQYINNRNLPIDPKLCTNGQPDTNCAQVGDLGPEGVLFIAPQDSPNKIPLLVIANQTSSSTTLYQVCSLTHTVHAASDQISISRGGFRYNRRTGRFVQTLMLKNMGAAIQDPLFLALDALSSNAKLFNKNGKTSCVEPSGSPYIAVNVGDDKVFNPGESTTVVLEFDNPSKQGIIYNTRLLAGEGDR